MSRGPGRPTGSTNKNSIFLMNRLKEMYGEEFDPIVNACEALIESTEIAREYRANEQPQEALDAYKAVGDHAAKITRFLHPTLKAQEVSIEAGEGGPPIINVNFVERD